MIRYEPADHTDKSRLFFLCKENIDHYEDLHAIRYAHALMWVRDKIEQHIDDYTAIWNGPDKVGYFLVHPADDQWEWEDFYLFPEHRGRGIGTRVLDEQLTTLADPVFLHVFSRNTRAVSLYRRFGFQPTQTIRGTQYRMERPARASHEAVGRPVQNILDFCIKTGYTNMAHRE